MRERECRTDGGSLAFYNLFVYEFWRFVFVQQEVARAAQTLIEFPPMQKGASFNMEAVKRANSEGIAVPFGVARRPEASLRMRGARKSRECFGL